MLEHKDSGRIFAVLQGLAFLIVIATVFFFRWKQKFLEKDLSAQLGPPELQAFVQKSRSPAGPKARQAETLALESTFPAWTKDTPPHVVLGVSLVSEPAEIEAAYKAQLKRFHPDRYASWGESYQARAHAIVLLLQEARSRLLTKR